MKKIDLNKVASLLKDEMNELCEDNIDTFASEQICLTNRYVEVIVDDWTFGVYFDATVYCEEDYDEDEYGRHYHKYASLEKAEFTINEMIVSDDEDNEITDDEFINKLCDLIEK